MPLHGTPLLREPRRHIREKRAESFRHGRMCENGIAQIRIWQARQDSHLYHGHGLAGFGADHREAKNAVVTRGDKRLHKALSFVDRVRPEHGAHRQFCDTRFDTLTLRLAFAQSHPCKRGIGKHAVRNQPVAGRAVCPGQIVPNDPEVVERDMRELWTALILPRVSEHRPAKSGKGGSGKLLERCSADPRRGAKIEIKVN